jgi:tetratricopeptide (TPR) repeat protein
MHNGALRIAALVAATLIAGTAGLAAADPPKPPSEADRKLASDLVKKAIARSQAGDHESAIEIYLQAFTLVPNSLLLSNIGAEFQQSDMLKEALDYFCRYLKEDPSGTNAPYALAQAKILRRQLGKKKVDDADVCKPPKESEEKRPRKRDPESSEPKEPGPEPATKAPGDSPITKTKDPFKPDPVARTGGNPTLMYTGLGVGILGLAFTGAGIYYGIQAKQLSDQISSQSVGEHWPNNIRDLEARGEHYNRLQIGWMVSGGVVTAAGIALMVVGWPHSSSSEHATIAVAPTTNGVSMFGRF